MKSQAVAVVLFLVSLSLAEDVMAIEFNYNEMIILDAEDLAERGIKDAYESLLPQLRHYVSQPAAIEEDIDNDALRYTVGSGGEEYVIYAPDLQEGAGQSWGLATYALFRIVNRQLSHSTYRLYAINSGNDLGGMFLTMAEVENTKRSLPRKTDWPYLPISEHPWYGQYH